MIEPEGIFNGVKIGSDDFKNLNFSRSNSSFEDPSATSYSVEKIHTQTEQTIKSRINTLR